jgi:hypothetical protein
MEPVPFALYRFIRGDQSHADESQETLDITVAYYGFSIDGLNECFALSSLDFFVFLRVLTDPR